LLVYSIFGGFRENSPPWTTLKMQYRMVPSSRHLVSGVFYDDTLIDAPEVLEMPFELPSTVLLLLQQC
jgi:hypothetical protein